MRIFRRLRGKTSHSASAEPHRCPHCEKTYKSKLSLAVHVHQTHSGEYEAPVCQYCGVTRCSPRSLRLHIMRKHTERPPRVKCPFPGCRKSFKTCQDQRRHAKLVHMPRQHRKHKCTECHYVAKTRGMFALRSLAWSASGSARAMLNKRRPEDPHLQQASAARGVYV